MNKLLIGTALCALLAGPALAGESTTNEPVRLSLTEMDGVTAGCDFAICAQFNLTFQEAEAEAEAETTSVSAILSVLGGHSSATALASNSNATAQFQGND